MKAYLTIQNQSQKCIYHQEKKCYVPKFYECENQNRENQVQVHYRNRGLGFTKFQCEQSKLRIAKPQIARPLVLVGFGLLGVYSWPSKQDDCFKNGQNKKINTLLIVFHTILFYMHCQCRYFQIGLKHDRLMIDYEKNRFELYWI